jgi:hypothetical protein
VQVGEVAIVPRSGDPCRRALASAAHPGDDVQVGEVAFLDDDREAMVM